MDEYKSLLSGFISGAIHTIVGYPLDTLKTLKQSNQLNQNQNQNQIQKPKKIFKGVIYPVAQVSLVNALMFGSNDYFKKNHSIYVSNLYSGVLISLYLTIHFLFGYLNLV